MMRPTASAEENIRRAIAHILTPHVCGPFVRERRGHMARRGTVLCAGCGSVHEEHFVTLPREAGAS